MAEEFHIGINKTGNTLFLILFGCFAVGGAFGFFAISESDTDREIIWIGAGIAMFIIFGLAFGALLKKRRNKRAGLIFGKEGIEDNSTSMSIGLIKWRDIKNIDQEKCIKNSLLIVDVRKPNEYIKQARNGAIKRLLEQNISKYGSPVVIEPFRLNCSTQELIEWAIEQRKKRL